jgi:hypothetical protein
MSGSPGILPFLDTVRPPGKAGGRADEIGPRLEDTTASELGILEVVDTGEMAVGQRGVGQRTADVQRVAVPANRQARTAGGRVPARGVAHWHATYAVKNEDDLAPGTVDSCLLYSLGITAQIHAQSTRSRQPGRAVEAVQNWWRVWPLPKAKTLVGLTENTRFESVTTCCSSSS